MPCNKTKMQNRYVFTVKSFFIILFLNERPILFHFSSFLYAITFFRSNFNFFFLISLSKQNGKEKLDAIILWCV